MSFIVPASMTSLSHHASERFSELTFRRSVSIPSDISALMLSTGQNAAS